MKTGEPMLLPKPLRAPRRRKCRREAPLVLGLFFVSSTLGAAGLRPGMAGRGGPRFGPSTVQRGNPACWGDKNYALTAEDCCHRLGCFAQDASLEEGVRAIVKGNTYGIWTREKCCDRPVNRTSFHGFANPLLYLASSHIQGTKLGDRMLEDGVLLDAPGLGVGTRIRILPQTAGEIPADVVSEILRYRKNQAFYEAAIQERRREFSIGTKSCNHVAIGRLGGLVGGENFLSYVVALLTEGNRLVAPQGRFINIGANDGVQGDPLEHILKSRLKTSAMAAEMDVSNCIKHRINLPHVHLWCDMVKPDNVWNMTETWIPLASPAWRRPRNLTQVLELPVDILKMDIDSFDCALVEEMLYGSWRESKNGPVLARIKPSLVVLETNDAIPPPIKMSLRYHRSLSTVVLASGFCDGNIPLAGCSLSYQAATMAKLGYGLVMFASANAAFVDLSLLPFLTKASRGKIVGPLDEIDCYRNVFLSSQCGGPRQIRRWFQEGLPAWQVLQEVTEHLKAIELDFELPEMPLTLTL